MFNYDVGRRRLVTFWLYATDGRFVSSVLCMYGGLQASYLVPEMGNLPT